MNSRAKIGISVLAASSLVLAGGCSLTRAGYQTAPYQVVRKTPGFEIRDYPAIRVAETKEAGGGFMRLFRYIDHGNAESQGIAMTTPVWMDRTESQGTMSFVLPSGLSSPPAPKDPEVRIRELPAGSWAVRRFKGSGRGPDDAAARVLGEELRKAGIPTTGTPRFAYFDPPWIPGFLRRNEVMIQVVPGDAKGAAASPSK